MFWLNCLFVDDRRHLRVVFYGVRCQGTAFQSGDTSPHSKSKNTLAKGGCLPYLLGKREDYIVVWRRSRHTTI